MEVYVGTSGWLYDWNMEGSLEWYLKFSELNAVELNASFYRFPYPKQVMAWAKYMKFRDIRWAIKVHRGVTHFKKLGLESLDIWRRFYGLFKPLDSYVDFYLFQMPPSFRMNNKSIERIVKFVEAVDLGSRFAIEFRDTTWFNNDVVNLCRKLGITVVSIDSPIGRWISLSNGTVYMRLHGRETWYNYNYSYSELVEIGEEIADLNPDRVYVFFNNNHWMLENARTMLKILKNRYQKPSLFRIT